ncbi:hypothetical protein N0V88_005144 [Collariella sp. IMI 366227]|nr:hypothetical protein N0V88_005144 [Collariella sp. IMI 366227]
MKLSHLLSTALCGASITQATLFPLPRTPYKVQWTSTELTDPSRPADPYNATHPRRIMISRFTPIPNHACLRTCHAPYMNTFMSSVEDGIIDTYYGDVGWPHGVLATLELEICCEVKKRGNNHPKKNQFPTVLFGTGRNTTRLLYSASAQSLASMGYEFPDGTVIYGGRVPRDPSQEEGLAFALDVRSKDASLVLDYLGVKKPRSVGYVGDSLGGAAVADAMLKDERIGAGVNVDGFMFGSAVKEGVNGPFLILGSPGDNSTSIPEWGVFRNAMKAKGEWFKELNLADSVHGILIDFGLIGDVAGLRGNEILVDYMFGKITGARTMEILRAYFSDFFDFALNGKGQGLLAEKGETMTDYTKPSRPFYPALSSANREIRLLHLKSGTETDELQCHLQVVSLDSNPSYEALSYCWGRSTANILVNDKYVSVPANLQDALRRFRCATEERILWADAICINQSQIEERNSQVAMMADIYKKCERCLIWMGQASDFDSGSYACSLPDLLTALSKKHHFDQPGAPVIGGGLGITRVPLMFLNDTAWWERIWVVQEAILAPRSVLFYGSLEMVFSDLVRAVEFVDEHDIGSAWGVTRQGTDDLCHCMDWIKVTMIWEDVLKLRDHVFRLLDVFRSGRSELNNNSSHPDIVDVMLNVRLRKCTDPRDKIFASLRSGWLETWRTFAGVSHAITLDGVLNHHITPAEIAHLTDQQSLSTIVWPDPVPIPSGESGSFARLMADLECSHRTVDFMPNILDLIDSVRYHQNVLRRMDVEEKALYRTIVCNTWPLHLRQAEYREEAIVHVQMDELLDEERKIVEKELLKHIATLKSLRSDTPGIPGDPEALMVPPQRLFNSSDGKSPNQEAGLTTAGEKKIELVDELEYEAADQKDESVNQKDEAIDQTKDK